MRSSGWVAVRCIFRSVVDDTQTFEERVTIWRTADPAVGIRFAEDEALTYAQDMGATYTGLAQAYLLADEVEHGAEVFSLNRDSDLPTEEYLDRYFDTGTERQGELTPDVPAGDSTRD